MQDKTSLGISDTFREYIESLAEEVVVNGESFEVQKKWLRKYSEAEGLKYETFENNLTDLFEAIKELEEHESKSGERLIGFLAKECYLSEALVNKLINNAAAIRAQKEEENKKEDVAYRKCTTIAACNNYLKAYPQGRYVQEVRNKKTQLEQEDSERKAQEEKERKAREESERKKRKRAETERKAKEEAERKAREEAERKAKEESKKKQTIGMLNGHEYVDLGLPSGTLWATCNVGATKPEEFGDYYAWGEIKPKTVYDWDTYKYSKVKQRLFKKVDLLTKYCDNSEYGYEGFTDELTVLKSADDPATTNWGNGWCTPSMEQWVELKENTKSSWTTRNGVDGWSFRANNGNSLFLPEAGFRENSDLYVARGYYWSSSLYRTPDGAWTLEFQSGAWDYCYVGCIYRYRGQSVRPVRSARQN